MKLNQIREWLDRTLDDKNVIVVFRDIGQGVKNLIKWFPVIWNDRQWDHFFVFYILKKKLELMSKAFRTNAYSADADKDADRMDYCINVIDRILKSEYNEIAFKDLYEKWGKSEMNFEPIENRDGFSRLLITHKNVKTEEDQKQFDKEFRLCLDHEEYLERQDLTILFQTMEKHIRTWWD